MLHAVFGNSLVCTSRGGDGRDTLLSKVVLSNSTSSTQRGRLESWCLFLFHSPLKAMHTSTWLAGISWLSHGRTLEKGRIHTKDFIHLGEEGGGGQTAGVHLSSL